MTTQTDILNHYDATGCCLCCGRPVDIERDGGETRDGEWVSWTVVSCNCREERGDTEGDALDIWAQSIADESDGDGDEPHPFCVAEERADGTCVKASFNYATFDDASAECDAPNKRHGGFFGRSFIVVRVEELEAA